jgi:hypothetical protein
MAEHGDNKEMVTRSRVPLSKHDRWALAMIVTWALLFLGFPCPAPAEPLDYTPWASGGFEALFAQLEGRMGFNQQAGGAASTQGTTVGSTSGTQNDFKADLGLPTDTQTYRILLGIRPLEHHNLRFYGAIPEQYKGSAILARQLQSRLITYDAGTSVLSELRTAMFGFGYDCDFLVMPRFFGGITGDIKYIDLRVRLAATSDSWEDTITIDELTPCVGAHFQTGLPIGTGLTLGAYGRMCYAMTPDYLNYVDVSAGLTAGMRPESRIALDAKVGFEHQSFIVEQEQTSGRRFEMKRTGIVCSVEAAF